MKSEGRIEVLRGISVNLSKDDDIKRRMTDQVGKYSHVSTRHKNAIPYYPTGLIVETNIDNVYEVSKIDLQSIYRNYKSIDRILLIKWEKAEKPFTFGGEIVLQNIAKEDIKGIYLDKNTSRFTRSHDGNFSKHELVGRLMHALVIREIYYKTRGNMLDIIDIETKEMLDPDTLKEEIKEIIKNKKPDGISKNSLPEISKNSLPDVLQFLTLMPELFKELKAETNGFDNMRGRIIDYLFYGEDNVEVHWNSFIERLEEQIKRNSDSVIENTEEEEVVFMSTVDIGQVDITNLDDNFSDTNLMSLRGEDDKNNVREKQKITQVAGAQTRN